MENPPVYKVSRRRSLPFFVECFTYTSYPLHTHEYYEIELIRGYGFHNVIDSVDHVINGAMCFVYMPYTRHYYYADSGEGASIYRVGFGEGFVPGEIMELMHRCGHAFAVMPGEVERRISGIFMSLQETDAGNMGSPYLETVLRADLSKLIAVITERYMAAKKNSGTIHPPVSQTDPALTRVYSYIAAHFNRDISLPVLASEAGMSPGYFSRYFKGKTGMTYSEYLTGIRMNYAANLLKMTGYSLKRVSSETGYYSESGFIKAFTRFFGTHPDRFRKEGSDFSKRSEHTVHTSIVSKQKKQIPPLLPQPKEYTYTGTCFSLRTTISTAEDSPADFRKAAVVCAAYARRLYDISFAITDKEDGAIRFVYMPEWAEEEYGVHAADGIVTIRAATLSGASHGASVLLQLMQITEGKVSMPACRIWDRPDNRWRGLMVDLARGQYPLADILTYADLCYFYRLRVLHLHFADGMVYTLPSKKYPKLPVGCWHYDRETVETLTSYLTDRGILLLPEIEMPAHADVLVHTYPEIFGEHDNMICPGHPGVLEALDSLIGEVCDLFPTAPYIHIGCDEAQYTKWDDCPLCRKFMEEHQIPTSGALYTYMVDKTTRMVLAHGRRPVVWEGFPAEGMEKLSRDVIVMVFESLYQDANALGNAGFQVINTSWQPLYIVPSRPKYWYPADIYRWKTTRWLYEDAVDDSSPIDAKNPDMVLGAQLCVWESMNFARDGEIVCANLPTLAERTWNDMPTLSFDEYENLAQTVLAGLATMIDNRKSWFDNNL